MVLRRRTRGIGGEAALAALSLAPSLIALRGGDLAAYHGVEHKAIGAYEQDADDARDATKEHDRCGSHLMAPLLAANLAGTRAPAPRGRAPVAAGRRRGRSSPRSARPSRCSRGPSATATPPPRALCAGPGHELQRVLGTREPTEEQLDVGRAALAEILRAEGSR